MRGTVKKLDRAKGWGFLKTDTGDVFFHRSAVRGQPFEFLEEGQEVEYDLGERKDGKGPRAGTVWVS